MTVIKKAVSGDGIFEFGVKSKGPIYSVLANDLAKVFAFNLEDQENNFSITTQGGSGSYSADYEISSDTYGIDLAELTSAGWKTENIVCRSDSEFFYYQILENKAEIYGIEDGENIECEFTNERIKNPILIIPGLLGTELFNEQEKIWPNILRMSGDGNDGFMDVLSFNDTLSSSNNISIQNVISSELFNDYTHNLISQLTSPEGGYREGVDLFTFPYDWRYGVSGKYSDGTISSDLLNEKIEEILQQTGAGKVDIIAHSLGGLVAKRYVMDNIDPKIGKLIFVGVPNLGSPIAAKAILMGDNFKIVVLSGDRIREISQNMPAAHDLLPSYRYRDTIANYIKLAEEQPSDGFSAKNLSFGESQEFLDNHGANALALNESNSVHNISGLDDFDVRNRGVDAYKIVGCGSGMPMQVKANKGIDGSVDYEPYSYISSDDTVPFGSADSIQAENEKSFYAIKAKHGAMMGADGIRQTIANILTGSNLTVGNNVINKNQLIGNINQCSLNGVAVKIYSPLDIEVFDQNGKRLGSDENGNFQNDIPGASFDVVDGHKFVYLPTGQSEQYQINLLGTGAGTFTLETQNIENNIEGKSRIFENIAVSPSLKAFLAFNADGTILKMDNNGDGAIDQVLTRTDAAPDTIPATINSIVSDSSRYFEQGLIKSRGAYLVLYGRLRALKTQYERYNSAAASDCISDERKKYLLAGYGAEINRQIDMIIGWINGQGEAVIDPKTAGILIGSLNYIRIQ